MFGLHIPQESVTIPESIDGIRAAMGMETDRLKAVGTTNRYLGLPYWKAFRTAAQPARQPVHG